MKYLQSAICYLKSSKGFSITEVMLAVALFAIFSLSGIIALVSSFDINRLAAEQLIAYQYASEGLEAVRSIKNQSFANVTNTSPTTGVTRNGSNVWAYSGTNNVLDTRYTRTVTVSDSQRDGSGNVVDSGGTTDTSTKKIVSQVDWNFTNVRPLTATLTTYLTNWKATIESPFNGLIAYGDTTTSPKYRTYTTSTNLYGAETSTVVSSAGQTFVLRTSPTKNEAIMGFVTATGELNVQCFDGNTWSQEWTTTVGGTGATRRFDIAYETNSGDVMVLYSTDTAPNTEVAYRTKAGSSGCGSANWTSGTNLSLARTNGIVQWVKMAWDRRSSSNLITAIFADANSDLSSAVWSGSAWGNEPTAALSTTLQVVTAAQDVEDFDVEYESVSGDVMIVWGTNVGAGANGVRYAVCVGGTSTCTWTLNLTPVTFVDDATNLDISANPNTNELLFASVGKNQRDLQLGYWSGTAWTNIANADTSCNTPIAGAKTVATGWLISGGTTRGVVRYADQGSSALDWYTSNGSAFTKQTDFTQTPAPTNPRYYDIAMDPLNPSQLISAVSDANNRLFAKRGVMNSAGNFTWTNSDGNSTGGLVLQSNLGQPIASPYAQAFKRF